MKYLQIIWADGMPTPDQLAIMQRDLPGWAETVNRRGWRLLGRELDLPETAATVRVRDGEALVTDGPFAETKEFIAGFDVLDCADLDEALEVAITCPISQFQPIEIRPLTEEVLLGERAFAFGRSDDGVGRPYLLSLWVGPTPTVGLDEPAVSDEVDAWRRDVDGCGRRVLGSALGGPQTARTVRARDGQMTISTGPFSDIDEFVAGIEVLSCPDRQEAIELAATHPLARHHAIEVRPFYVE